MRSETLVVDEFLLQGGPEAFDHGVVVAAAITANALRHAMLLEKISTRMTCILQTTMAVMPFDQSVETGALRPS